MGNWCGCCEPPTVSRAGDLPALSREAKNGSGKHNVVSCTLPEQGACAQELGAHQRTREADTLGVGQSVCDEPCGAPAAPEPGSALSLTDEAEEEEEEEEEESTSDSGPHDTEDTDDFTDSAEREAWKQTCRKHRIEMKKYRRYCINGWMDNAETEDRDDPAPMLSACLAADYAQTAPNEATGSELGDGDAEENTSEQQERAAAAAGVGSNSSNLQEQCEGGESPSVLTGQQANSRRTAGARAPGSKKQLRAEASGKAKNAAARNCMANQKRKPPGRDEAQQHPGRRPGGFRSVMARERAKK